MRPEIKAFFDVVKPRRYLEIGLGGGGNFRSIPLDQKVVISPKGEVDSGIHYRDKSDKVFAGDFPEDPFDLIFIDGHHEYCQNMRDIFHSFAFLGDNGVILCHDINPLDMPDIVSEKRMRSAKWCGDVWKCVFHVKFKMPSIAFATVEDFPGWLVLWRARDPREPVRQRMIEIMVEGGIHSDLGFMFDRCSIGLARKFREEFEFGTLDEAVEKYRNDN